jgi:predicted acetyltransferase
MSDVRTITPEELPAWMRVMGIAFHETFDPGPVAEVVREIYDLERVWAGFADGVLVSTLRGMGTRLTVPGGAQVPATALSAVTVLPTHRRRGLLTRMIAAEHAASRDRGEPLGLLYASEYPIYGRFGYGAAIGSATWTVDALNGRVLGEPAGTVELADPAASLADVTAVFEAHRAVQVGEIWRRPTRFEFDLGLRSWPDEPGWKGRLVLHRDSAGGVDGYARYTAKDVWEHRQPRYPLEVGELLAITDGAYLDLWRFLVEQDLVSSVRAERRRVDEPLTWILENARHAEPSEVGDGMFASLLDVRGALAARTYAREDGMVLEVVGGPWGPGARERVRLEGGPDGATCMATDAAPDLTLRSSALGAAYLGGGPLRSIVLAGGADEHTPGALARADAMLRTADPAWCTTFF